MKKNIAWCACVPALLLAASACAQTNNTFPSQQQVEQARMDCIQHRRAICGRIVKVLPEGLVVDSGYTNLMRPPLNHSWLVPGSVKTERAAHLVEGSQPDGVCVGLVFLTDLPRKPAPRIYDYVNLTGYPIAPRTYDSVGRVQRTVRGFTTTLAKAVQWKLAESGKQKRQ